MKQNNRQNLNREEIHRLLQERDLIEVLDTVRGQSGENITAGIEELGSEVERAVNNELLLSLHDPLDSNKRLIGFLALLYEAENQTRIENELNG